MMVRTRGRKAKAKSRGSKSKWVRDHKKPVVLLLAAMICLLIPITAIMSESLWGYQAPVAQFYSLNSTQQGIDWKVTDPTPALGEQGVWVWHSKDFQYDYENFKTEPGVQPDRANWPDLLGDMSVMDYDYSIDLNAEWGIPSSYVHEEVRDGQTVTVQTEVSLRVYSLTVTFIGLPDGRECTGDRFNGPKRSWEPTWPIEGVSVGVSLDFTHGIVSNCDESFALFLLVVSSDYDTNDGEKIDVGNPLFPGPKCEDVQAIGNPRGTGKVFDLYSLFDNETIGVGGTGALPNFVENIEWMDAAVAAEYTKVFFETGITKFQCAYWYDWNGNVGPVNLAYPRVDITFDVHVLLIGRMIFELPQDEIPEYNIQVDLHDRAGPAGWWTTLLWTVAGVFIAILVTIVVIKIITRPRPTQVYVQTGSPRRRASPSPKKQKKKKKRKIKFK